MKKQSQQTSTPNPRFEQTRDRIIAAQTAQNGIGTLAEKTIHAVLKSYYAVFPEFEEKKCAGFVADICNGFEIKEIQTRQFYKCRRKLDAFLPEYDVTMVYPIPAIKWLRWIDPESGEITKAKKSPKHGTPYAIFIELYGIKDYLKNPNLHFLITMLEVEEYKFLDGYGPQRKIRAHRSDGMPLRIIEEISLQEPRDFLMFLPAGLPDVFTSGDLSLIAKIPLSLAQTTLNILYYLELVDRVGKKGNSFLYEVIEL